MESRLAVVLPAFKLSHILEPVKATIQTVHEWDGIHCFTIAFKPISCRCEESAMSCMKIVIIILVLLM